MGVLLLLISTCGKKNKKQTKNRANSQKRAIEKPSEQEGCLLDVKSPFTGFKLTEDENENLIINVYIPRTYITLQFP